MYFSLLLIKQTLTNRVQVNDLYVVDKEKKKSLVNMFCMPVKLKLMPVLVIFVGG